MEPRFRGRQQDSGFELPTSHSFDRGRRSAGGSKYKVLVKEEEEPLFPKAFTLPLVLVLIVASFSWIKYMDSRLPAPLTISDIESHPGRFIEERARRELELFTRLGPRVCGSHANDIAAVELLVRLLREIDRTKKLAHKIEIDVQKATGAFYMGFQEGLTSTYSSVPIVLAKLEPASGPSNDSILVNCHFDSVAGSPGASDDMVNCATMLEILRVLSRQEAPLKNNIVFLFNGAEENGMQASHGFVAGKQSNNSQIGHPWAKNLRAFVNLEASGAGGRQVLFQTGPGNGWILESCKQAPYPYGSVVGEEIFQRGLIPSDTDYRVFRDHAKIPGLDFAFIKNGWVYHTRFDNIDNITPGSIQQSGENIISITRHLAGLDFKTIEYNDEKMVYYDLYGLFLMTYSEKVSIVISVLVGGAAVYFAWFESNGNGATILYHVIVTLLAWIVGIIAAVSVGVVLNAGKYFVPFFSHPALALVIFGIPCLMAQVMVFSFALQGQEWSTWIAGKTTLGFLLLGLSFSSRALFSVAINLAFGIAGWALARKLFKDPQRKLLFYLSVGEVVPLTMSLYLVNNFVDVFVPIMGRSGTESNPNLFVAVLTAVVLTVPTFTGLVPIFVFLKRSFYKVSSVIMVLLVAFIVFGIGKVPYSEKTPMRLHLVEVDRTWYDLDLTTVKRTESGFWFFNLDPNVERFLPLFQEKLPEIKDATTIESDKCDDLYCGLPYYFPVINLIRRTQWLPKPYGLSIDLKGRIRMDLLHDSFITPSVRRLTFSFIGPDHMTVILCPGKNFKLSKWSLTAEIPETKIYHKNRPTYFIYHGRGINFERFEFSVELTRKSAAEIDASNDDDTLPKSALDVTFSGYWLHGPTQKSDGMKHFLNGFPDWAYGLGWSAASNVYSIP